MCLPLRTLVARRSGSSSGSLRERNNAGTAPCEPRHRHFLPRRALSLPAGDHGDPDVEVRLIARRLLIGASLCDGGKVRTPSRPTDTDQEENGHIVEGRA